MTADNNIANNKTEEKEQNQNQLKQDDRWGDRSPLDDLARELKAKNEARKAKKLKKATKERQKQIKRNKKIAIKRMKAFIKAKEMSKQQSKSIDRRR